MAKPALPPIEVDERTDNLEDDFLLCRAEHDLGPSTPATSARRAELRKLGQFETYKKCRRCTAVRTTLRELPLGTVVSSSYDYPDGYLLPPGSGRLPRYAAVAAYVSRHARQFL